MEAHFGHGAVVTVVSDVGVAVKGAISIIVPPHPTGCTACINNQCKLCERPPTEAPSGYMPLAERVIVNRLNDLLPALTV